MANRTHRRLLAVTATTAVFLGLASDCDDASGPFLRNEVGGTAVTGVQINSSAFRSSGDFALGLVVTDVDGNVIQSTQGLDFEARLTEVDGGPPTGFTLTLVEAEARIPEDNPIAAAIDLDDSGSMAGTDPNRLRADAAKAFWEAFLDADADNEVSLFDFGQGVTPPFTDTRLLQDWTRDKSALEAQLVNVQAGGGTPLYESVLDVVGHINATRSATAFNRVILLLTDGQPNSDANRQAALDAATSSGITIHTVGLGPASDLSQFPSEDAVERVRELAERTGGVYAAATDAAALSQIFQNLAQASSSGQLIALFRISPVPPPGTRLTGEITVTGGGGTATSVWSFIAP